MSFLTALFYDRCMASVEDAMFEDMAARAFRASLW